MGMATPIKTAAVVSLGALALGACVVGCSSAGSGFVSDDSGAAVGNGSGSAAHSGAGHSGSGSGGTGSGSSSGSGSGTSGGSGSSGSGSGSGGGSGSGASGSGTSGSSGSADAGAGGSPDAGGNQDAGAIPDASVAGSDAGLCADESAWLTPMNAERASVNAGEPPLVCDPIAAQVALNYANKCMFAHNMNRNSDYSALGGKGAGLGENIAAGAPTESIAAAVASWNSESMYYTYSSNSCASGQQCGHYTQVVWKTTTAVGCAHVSCTTNSPFGGSGKWDLSVCDFSPPGNYVGMKPY
jgi:pathogenesis-related protein 1